MAIETATNKGLTISFDDGDFSTGTVSVLLDLDLRTGTPVDETGWLDGNAGGSYPGTLAGFNAANTDGNAAGSMRMVQIAFTLADAAEQSFFLSVINETATSDGAVHIEVVTQANPVCHR